MISESGDFLESESESQFKRNLKLIGDVSVLAPGSPTDSESVPVQAQLEIKR